MDFKRKGWWGKVRADQVPGYDPNSDVPPDKIVQLGSPRRLKTIFNVNSAVANNAGRYKFYMQNAASRPYWLYVQIDRLTKRKSHEPFNGKVFRYDDPIWDIIYPPNGWNCSCYIIALTEEEMKMRGLKLSKGKSLQKYIKQDIPEEWQYNPAKEYASWKPDLSNYDVDLRAVYGG